MFIVLILGFCLSAGAQDRTLEYDSALWLRSRNATGLGVQDFNPYGTTRLGADIESGSYHRAQQAQSIVNYGGSSEGYVSLPKLRLYGSFDYKEQLKKNLAWCDNIDPYEGNPYIAGQSIPGDYNKQSSDFSVGLSSLRIANPFWAGVAMDYSVAEFSRQNDPRSRAQLASWSLRPGISFDLGGGHVVGVNAEWKHRKEKLLKLVSKSETLDKFKYYDFKSLADYIVVNPAYFSRRYISDSYGGSLQYSYNAERVQILAEAGYLRRGDDITGNQSESPGRYFSNDITASVIGSIQHTSGKSIFGIEALVGLSNATEYIQEEVVEMNDKGMMDTYWETLMEKPRYEACSFDVDAHWAYYLHASGASYKTKLEADINCTGNSQMSYSPASDFSWTRMSAMLNSTTPVGKWLFSCGVGYIFPLSGVMNITVRPEESDKTIIRDEVLSPDMVYLQTASLRLDAGVRYFFNIAGYSFYAGLSTHNLMAGRHYVALDLGLLTLGKK